MTLKKEEVPQLLSDLKELGGMVEENSGEFFCIMHLIRYIEAYLAGTNQYRSHTAAMIKITSNPNYDPEKVWLDDVEAQLKNEHLLGR